MGQDYQKSKTWVLCYVFGLWEFGGKVRNVTYTLPLETMHAIRALFYLVSHREMAPTLPDVARDVEAGEMNGASIINTYRCHPSIFDILEHVAADVCTKEAKPLSQVPLLALNSDGCTDWSTKDRDMWYIECATKDMLVTFVIGDDDGAMPQNSDCHDNRRK